MELVRGQTLDTHVAARGMAERAKIDLWARICDAVHHAHQKGVIHCDLKPANILVDDTGQPKVLDFGVARATDSDLRATTVEATFAALAGTLPYMSPEQTLGDPGVVDTRSDVYALGVVGYELLANRLPLPLEGMNLLAAVEAIRDVEPPRLAHLDRRLRGDVDSIVHKALAKERNRRYASAAELAADLRRFLAGDPILSFDPRQVGAEARALHADVLARRRTVLGTAHRHTLLSQVALAGVHGQLGDYAKAASLLDEAIAEGEPVLGPLHTIVLTAKNHLASVRGDTGDGANALALAREVLAAREIALGADHPDTLAVAFNCATLLLRLGNATEAERALADLLPRQERALGAHHRATIETRLVTASAYQATGRNNEAETLLHALAQEADLTLGDAHPTTFTIYNNLADHLFWLQDRVADCLPWYEKALAAGAHELAEDHPNMLATAMGRARALARLGRVDEAVREGQRVLTAWQARADDDALEVMNMRDNLARICFVAQRWDEAARHLARLVDWLLPRLPDEPLRAAAAARMQAECAIRLGALTDAAAHLQRTQTALAAACGADHDATRLVAEARAKLAAPNDASARR